MFARLTQILALASLILVAAPARSEDAPADPREQFRQMREEFLKKMQDKGIDPQEYFRDIGEQMRDGKLDFSGLQQKLQDSGLIDEKAIAKMREGATNATLGNIRRQLDVTDAEWNTLQPKIQRVITAQGDYESTNPFGGAMSGMFRMQQPNNTSEVAKKAAELKAGVRSAETTPAQYQQLLSAWRSARAKAKEELTAAQKDLTEVVTARQEAALTLLGLL